MSEGSLVDTGLKVDCENHSYSVTFLIEHGADGKAERWMQFGDPPRIIRRDLRTPPQGDAPGQTPSTGYRLVQKICAGLPSTGGFESEDKAIAAGLAEMKKR